MNYNKDLMRQYYSYYSSKESRTNIIDVINNDDEDCILCEIGNKYVDMTLALLPQNVMGLCLSYSIIIEESNSKLTIEHILRRLKPKCIIRHIWLNACIIDAASPFSCYTTEIKRVAIVTDFNCKIVVPTTKCSGNCLNKPNLKKKEITCSNGPMAERQRKRKGINELSRMEIIDNACKTVEKLLIDEIKIEEINDDIVIGQSASSYRSVKSNDEKFTLARFLNEMDNETEKDSLNIDDNITFNSKKSKHRKLILSSSNISVPDIIIIKDEPQ